MNSLTLFKFEFSWYFLGTGKVQAAKMVLPGALELLQVGFGRWRLLRHWAGTGFLPLCKRKCFKMYSL